MKTTVFLLFILTFYLFEVNAQSRYNGNNSESKTFLLEKIGTHQRYAFEVGDLIKLRAKNREIMWAYLWEINDSAIWFEQNRPVLLTNIESVYPQFSFPKKFGIYMFIAGAAYFTVISLNHLINREIVFTKDVFVVPTALFGTGLLSVSLSQKRCKIGDRWKLKVLGIRIQ